MTNQEMLDSIKFQAEQIHHIAVELTDRAERIIKDVTREENPDPPTPPQPEPPFIPYPNLDRVIMRKNAPLMEVFKYNKKWFRVLRRHKKENGKPIVAKEGKKLIVLAKVKIDGYRNYAFRLISDQHVDGDSLPLSNTTKKNKAKQIDGYLYIQKRLVKML